MKNRFGWSVLAVSLVANLALVASVIRLNDRLTEQQAPSPRPFRWAQLESTDYPTYIANLRTIGCPEQTVREIIAADVVDLYAPRRAPLLAKLSGSNAAPAERGQAEEALRQLRQEESAIMRRLFGIAEPEKQIAQSSTPPAPDRALRHELEDTNVSMPLVFQSVDTNAVKLTTDQLQTISEVRESFLEDLGTNQDVNDPDYRRRWQAAQKQADSLLDALLGRQFYLQYQDGVQNQSDAGGPASAQNQP
jgi:hypothetical protein